MRSEELPWGVLWFERKYGKIWTMKLATIMFSMCLASFAALGGEIVLEAESVPSAKVEKDARASGGQVVAGLGRGAELVFSGVQVEKDGRYLLTLETFDSQSRSVGLGVNGGKLEMREIAPGYDNTAGVGVWEVSLKAGANEIRLANEKSAMPSIDKLTIVPVIPVTEAPGRAVIPFDDGWSFKWGKDKKGDGWKVINLPHDAQFEQPWSGNNSSGARGYKPMGEMWYRKEFQLSDLGVDVAGKRVFLELGGLLCVGDVYVNGKKVAETDYGYLPVVGEITDALRKGKNVVEVWCSTGRKEGSRWYTGAGLYRDARIVVKPQVSVARNGIFVRSRAEGDAAKVGVTVELDGFRGKGRKAKLDISVAILDAGGAKVAEATARAPWSKNEHQEVQLPEMTIAGAKLWDVDSPNLYVADVRLVYDGTEIDRERVRFGVKTVELDYAFGMKLNGRKIFLKSMSNHHDMGCIGAAAYRRAIERQFKLMKEFGYNAIRCSHNPYSEDFYELADEYGLLVMDELIDKWTDGSYWFGRKPFTTIWPKLVTEWMKRDRNHPSIFAWSFGNEFQMRDDLCGYAGLNDWGVTMYKVIKALSERWDDTRPTTVAMYPARAGAVSKTDPGFWDDPHAPELALASDFASLNYQSGVYKDYVRNAPGLNIFQSEAEAYVLQQSYLAMDQEHSIGCSYWGAVEYWGESNGWPKKGWNYSFFSHSLEPYPCAYLIKSVMSGEPVVRIAVKTGKGVSMNWNGVQVGTVEEKTFWEGEEGEVKTVRVYTNCPEVELFLNGKSLGKKANDSGDIAKKNILTWEVSYEPGELVAKAAGAEDSVKTAGEAVALKVVVEADDYKADGRDLIYLRCYAVDSNGVRVRKWQDKVSFSCQGAASFLCCDNDDHYTNELFTSDITAKAAKDGFILAVFRAGATPGEATITVSPDSLPAVTLSVPVRGK